MIASGNNLLVRLHKWATRQDENFLTEAFVHLLQHFLDHEREMAIELVMYLSEGRLVLTDVSSQTATVSTQVVVPQGRPDVSIRTWDHLLLVEVKKEAILGEFQLERYRRFLRESKVPNTGLILLTRYPVVFGADDEKPDVGIRWYQLGDWLDTRCRSAHWLNPATSYVVAQLIGFLKAQGMFMEQVNRELASGLRSWQNLRAMVYEAIVASGVQYKDKEKLNWFWVHVSDAQYTVSISMDTPTRIWFGTWKARFDPEKAEQLGFNIEKSDSPKDTGPYRWFREYDIESELVQFFSKSKAEQMQCLEQFIRGSLMLAKQCTTATAGTKSQGG